MSPPPSIYPSGFPNLTNLLTLTTWLIDIFVAIGCIDLSTPFGSQAPLHCFLLLLSLLVYRADSFRRATELIHPSYCIVALIYG